MANTYTSLHYHIVFSTKNRQAWIHQDIEQRVWKYVGGIIGENDMKPIQVGGIEDHLHVLLGAPPAMAVSKAVQLLKGGSSKWIHVTLPSLAEFGWQDGYGAFSVSRSNLDTVRTYIVNQRQHHQRTTFQDEYRALLKRHGVEFDERYVWG